MMIMDKSSFFKIPAVSSIIISLAAFFGCTQSRYTIDNVGTITNNISLDVTQISYTPEHTTITFRSNDQHRYQSVIGRDIALVDDKGVKHNAITINGQAFDSDYTIPADTMIELSIGFTPVNASNKALDLNQGKKSLILGMHDGTETLVLPNAEISGYALAPIKGKMVNIEIVLQGYEGNGDDVNVIVQYQAPTGYRDKTHHSAQITEAGHFHTSFVMYAPEILFVHSLGVRQQHSNVLVSPGDDVLIDMNEDGTVHVSRQSDNTDYTTMLKDGVPSWGSIDHKYLDNLSGMGSLDPSTGIITEHKPFSKISYEKQRQILAEEYNKALERARYIVWHYSLSQFHSGLYMAQLHDAFCMALISTEGAAANAYDRAISPEERIRYELSTRIEAYDFLKNIPQDETAFTLIKASIPGMIAGIRPISECANTVSENVEHWCTTVLEKQMEELCKMTGWDKKSYMAQLTLVCLLENMTVFHNMVFTTSKAEVYDWVMGILSDSYCRSLVDGIYLANTQGE